MKFFDKTKLYAPSVVRLCVGVVFFLIGLDQLLKPTLWASYFPQTLPFGISVAQAVLANGIFDIVIGTLLLIGLLTRIASAIGVLHLIGVIYTLSYNDISIRDIGILLGALSVFLHGPDKLSLDKKG